VGYKPDQNLVEKRHDMPQDVACSGKLLHRSSAEGKKRRGFAAFGPQAIRVPCLQTVSFGACDELLTSLMFFIGVGPVLKIEVEAMFRNNGINPVELFRNVKFEPGFRIADVDYLIWFCAAVTCP
jgi:hypothetical protein